MFNQDNEMVKSTNQSRSNIKFTMNNKKTNKKLLLILLIIIVIGATSILVTSQLFVRQENKEEILTVSTLEKIIKISELSTFQAVYNGIAEVLNEEKPDKLDYYVSYEAKVYAGIDFEEVKISIVYGTKKIVVTIPEIEITNVNVDIASLDYMFQNKRANTSTVSEQAYKACIADATNESKEEAAIYDLAEQNAENMIKALISPFIEQLASDYELVIN